MFTHGGQRLLVFGVDAYTWECLALDVHTSVRSRRVKRVLEAVIAWHGALRRLRSGNRPALSSQHYLAWCVEQRIEPVHIQPGRPMQNDHVESFRSRLRNDCLRESWSDGEAGLRSWKIY